MRRLHSGIVGVLICVVQLAALQSSAAAEAVRPAPCQKAAFKIALDIGHGRTRPGATSARGVSEFSYNLALGKVARSALVAAGFSGTFLVNEDGADIPLSRRPEIAREQGAALFIALHHDSVQPQYLSTWTVDGTSRPYSDRFSGYGIFTSVSSAWAGPSLLFAEALGRSLKARGFRPSLHHAEPIPGERRVLLDPGLGIYRFDELAVLRGARMPAVLLEAGIIVNRDEEKAIQDGPYRSNVAAALVSAAEQFCAAR